MKFFSKKVAFFPFLLFILFFQSCTSSSKSADLSYPYTAPVKLSRTILGPGYLTPHEMAAFFMNQNPQADKEQVFRLAQYYVLEGHAENINYSVAFSQMCLETGYLRFGNLVTPEMHNYCGLGAMDAEHPGCVFETEMLGVRAHIQHLQAYGTTEDVKLNLDLVDPRYNWVHKTKYIETIEGLTGTWATDPNYAKKLESILQSLEDFVNKKTAL